MKEASMVLAIAVIGIASAAAWITNAYKLTDCDFEAPYKCEVVHAVGVFVPPASIATVWVDSDK